MINKIKQLREETGASIMECKRALESCSGDSGRAAELIRQKQWARPRTEKEAKEGGVFSYVHNNRVGAIVLLSCNTDFVSKSEGFCKLGKEIAMQLTAVPVSDVETLLKSEYIRDASRTVGSLVSELAAKTGEGVEVVKFFTLGVV